MLIPVLSTIICFPSHQVAILENCNVMLSSIVEAIHPTNSKAQFTFQDIAWVIFEVVSWISRMGSMLCGPLIFFEVNPIDCQNENLRVWIVQWMRLFDDFVLSKSYRLNPDPQIHLLKRLYK